jgi:hypothetical protein
MIKLAELLKHIIGDEEDEGLTPVDNWSAQHTMYLEDIGFKNDGIYHYSLKKPEIRLSHKKGEGFIIEDKAKNQKQTLPKFKDLEEFFMNYKQEFENQPYNY